MTIKPKYLTLLIPFLCLSCNVMNKKPEVSNITQANIFEKPVTDNCHASTIVELLPNQLMAAWFGGTEEGAKDVGIYSSFYDGKAWSAPIELIKPLVTQSDTLPCWNPVLYKSLSNNLYLFYKVGKNPREWFGAMITSTDNGKTWTKPLNLPDGILGPIRNKPIEMTPGIILCGSSTENPENNEWRVHVEQYNEAIKEWKKIPIENNENFDIIQPTFIVHSENTVQMLCRSKHDKVISSWSEDKGNTWTNAKKLDMANSNSGIDALTLGKNSFLLVNNPLPRGTQWFNGRNVLDVEYSEDGTNWEKLLDLENQSEGEFSYPAIIQTADKKIHVLYTYNRIFIKHVAFDINR